MPHQFGRFWTGLLVYSIVVLAAACGGATEPVASPTTTPASATVISPTSTARPGATTTASITAAPSPTLSSTPTATSSARPGPSQTPSPTSIATKQVLLQFGEFTQHTGAYFGPVFERDLPQIVLYTDGELLIAGSYPEYSKTMLSTSDICSLLQQIANTGFFQVNGTGVLGKDDPIYNFGATPAPLVLGPSINAIQVNGNPAKFVGFYPAYEEYVINPIKLVLRLLKTYRPTGLRPYIPTRLLLWVETVQRGDQSQPRIWPENLPALADWLGGAPYNLALVQGDLVEPMLKLPQSHAVVYTDQGQEYSVVMRPLLPHETLDKNDFGPTGAVTFDLPFKCDY